MLSRSKKFIFFHIPKAGGTSLKHLLDDEATWQDIVVGATDFGEFVQKTWSKRYKMFKHTTPLELKHVIGDAEYSQYFKFVSVRHPFSRFISAFRFMRSRIERREEWIMTAAKRHDLIDVDNPDAFLESNFFIDTLNDTTIYRGELIKTFLPQCYFLDREEIKNNRFLIFKIEDLSFSTAPLVQAGILINEKRLPTSNVTPNTNEFTLTERSREKLVNFYKEDFNVLGYSKKHA